MQNMNQNIKNQTTQIKKQSRQLQNGNKQIQEDMFEMDTLTKIKEQKANEFFRQNYDIEREIVELEKDCNELTQCKSVLQSELNEEIAY